MDQKEGEAQRIEAEEEVFSHSSVLVLNAKKISFNDLDCQINYYKKKKYYLIHINCLVAELGRRKEKLFFLSVKILVDHRHNKYSLRHSLLY